MGTRVVIQSATVVEVESSSTSTTFRTIVDATTVNGNTDRRQSAILRQILRRVITK